MNLEKYTVRARSIVQAAQSLALTAESSTCDGDPYFELR